MVQVEGFTEPSADTTRETTMKNAFVTFHEELNDALKLLGEYPASHDEAKATFGIDALASADLIALVREMQQDLAEMEAAFGPYVPTVHGYSWSL